MGLVTLPDSLISSSSSITFFLQRFLRLFLIVLLLRVLSFTHAMSSPYIIVLIAASCTEMVSGGASLSRLESLHDTKRSSVAHEYF